VVAPSGGAAGFGMSKTCPHAGQGALRPTSLACARIFLPQYMHEK